MNGKSDPAYKGKVVCVVHGHWSNTGRIGDNIRRLGFNEVRCCVKEGDALPQVPEELSGAVVFGGPMSANDDDKLDFIAAELRWIEKILKSGTPFIGVCLGAQMLARCLGKTVQPHDEDWHEIGFTELVATDAGRELMGDTRYFYQWHSEGFDLPDGCTLLATSANGYFPNQLFVTDERVYGIQFHPECTLDIIKTWHGAAPHRLKERGAQQPEEQISAAMKYDHLVDRWVRKFMENWLLQSHETESIRAVA